MEQKYPNSWKFNPNKRVNFQSSSPEEQSKELKHLSENIKNPYLLLFLRKGDLIARLGMDTIHKMAMSAAKTLKIETHPDKNQEQSEYYTQLNQEINHASSLLKELTPNERESFYNELCKLMPDMNIILDLLETRAKIYDLEEQLLETELALKKEKTISKLHTQQKENFFAKLESYHSNDVHFGNYFSILSFEKAEITSVPAHTPGTFSQEDIFGMLTESSLENDTTPIYSILSEHAQVEKLREYYTGMHYCDVKELPLTFSRKVTPFTELQKEYGEYFLGSLLNKLHYSYFTPLLKRVLEKLPTNEKTYALFQQLVESKVFPLDVISQTLTSGAIKFLETYNLENPTELPKELRTILGNIDKKWQQSPMTYDLHDPMEVEKFFTWLFYDIPQEKVLEILDTLNRPDQSVLFKDFKSLYAPKYLVPYIIATLTHREHFGRDTLAPGAIKKIPHIDLFDDLGLSLDTDVPLLLMILKDHINLTNSLGYDDEDYKNIYSKLFYFLEKEISEELMEKEHRHLYQQIQWVLLTDKVSITPSKRTENILLNLNTITAYPYTSRKEVTRYTDEALYKSIAKDLKEYVHTHKSKPYIGIHGVSANQQDWAEKHGAYIREITAPFQSYSSADGTYESAINIAIDIAKQIPNNERISELFVEYHTYYGNYYVSERYLKPGEECIYPSQGRPYACILPEGEKEFKALFYKNSNADNVVEESTLKNPKHNLGIYLSEFIKPGSRILMKKKNMHGKNVFYLGGRVVSAERNQTAQERITAEQQRQDFLDNFPHFREQIFDVLNLNKKNQE